MTIRNIIVAVHADVDPAPQLGAALQVAHRCTGEIRALHVRPNPAAQLAVVPEAVLAYVDYEGLDEVGHERAKEARRRFEAWCDARPDPPKPWAWCEHEGVLEAVLERRGRLADLIVLRRPASVVPETEAAFDAAVFGTGRPCLLVGDEVPDVLLRHVLVAWNGSLEATRALVGAMPLLEAAERISVFAAPRPNGDAEHGRELVDALGWHRITAHDVSGSGGPETASPVGARLLRAAEGVGATLLIMGAYTHSRVRQMLLGGVTRHVLEHAKLPVLMAH